MTDYTGDLLPDDSRAWHIYENGMTLSALLTFGLADEIGIVGTHWSAVNIRDSKPFHDASTTWANLAKFLSESDGQTNQSLEANIDKINSWVKEYWADKAQAAFDTFVTDELTPDLKAIGHAASSCGLMCGAFAKALDDSYKAWITTTEHSTIAALMAFTFGVLTAETVVLLLVAMAGIAAIGVNWAIDINGYVEQVRQNFEAMGTTPDSSLPKDFATLEAHFGTTHGQIDTTKLHIPSQASPGHQDTATFIFTPEDWFKNQKAP